LAQKAGVPLRYSDKGEGENRQRRTRLIESVREAVDFYHQRLLSSPDAGPARAYLKSRGFDGAMVREYKLGWAPDDWDSLSRHLKINDKDLRDAGLGFLNRRNRRQDFFRARILFPIFNVNGDPIAFGGRKLPDDDGPKYRNTSDECVLYSKSSVLYGLNRSKSNIVASDEAIVCEGYTDVIGFAQAGMPRAVATCGTALTEQHFKVLKRFAKRVVLAFDADDAGQNAAERFYEWEQAYEIDVAVAELPAGVDPADLARSDPEALRGAIEDAKPFLGFRVDRVLDRADLRNPEGRARAAQAAVEMVRAHPNALVRDQYLMTIADRCRLEVEQLRNQQFATSRAVANSESFDSASPVRTIASTHDSTEDQALRLLLHDRDSIVKYLEPVLFESTLHRDALHAIVEASNVHDAAASGDPDVADLIGRLAVGEVNDNADDLVARLVDRAAGRVLRTMQIEARQSVDPASFAATITWLKLRIEDLRESTTSQAAIEQILPWLVEHGEGRQ
ncbi:MAG: toprim domain-containing protein, partial [Acidimicrobiales bacterium]